LRFGSVLAAALSPLGDWAMVMAGGGSDSPHRVGFKSIEAHFAINIITANVGELETR